MSDKKKRRPLERSLKILFERRTVPESAALKPLEVIEEYGGIDRINAVFNEFYRADREGFKVLQ